MRSDHEKKFLTHLGLDPALIVEGSVGVEFCAEGTMVVYSVRQVIEPQHVGIAMMVAAGMQVQEQGDPGEEPEKEGGGDG